LEPTTRTIGDYISEYSKQVDFYLEAAKACKEQCETLLERSGIRSMTTYRAKRPDHLEQKLLKRNREGRYGALGDNFRNVPDLAGVRIALYFPGDHAKTVDLVKSHFLVKLIRNFPEQRPLADLPVLAASPTFAKRFAGYSATHLRVHLRPESVHPEKQRYAGALIELQVASVLMHAWAEVEHDLIYKPLEGQLSEQELALLDQVNGLVMAGEIALERLQEAIKQRVSAQDKPFNNPYELAALLHNAAREFLRDSDAEPVIGRADLLLAFLRQVGLDRASQVTSLIENMNWANNLEPLSDQLIARAIAADPALTAARTAAYEGVLGRASQTVGQGAPTAAPIPSLVTQFIKRWVTLEQALRKLLRSDAQEAKHPRSLPLTRGMISKLEIFSEGELETIERLQKLRRELIDTDFTPSQKQLGEASSAMARLIKKLFDQAGPDLASSE
jgi:ppGpp synthetase/RelA/SpoT-type nucleotidyltranferase